MATEAEQKAWIATIAPYITKYAKQYGVYMAGFVIAQGCEESGWGTSSLAKNNHNYFGIGGPGNWYNYSSVEAGCEGYFKHTVLAKSDAAKKARTFDEYWKAYCAAGYGETDSAVYNMIKNIYDKHGLSKYNGSGGSSIKLEDLVKKAESYKGTRKAVWKTKHKKWYNKDGWSAGFIAACADEVGGILGKIMYGTTSPSELVSQSVSKYGAKTHSLKSSYKPKRGDIVSFTSSKDRKIERVALVTEFKDNVVKTIEAATNGKVSRKSYGRKASSIVSFCTLDWSKLDESLTSGGSSTIVGTLFDELNTREDAILREVAYMETVYKKNSKKKTVDKYRPKKDATDIKLSLINYTELFQSFWDAGSSLLNINGGSNVSGGYDYSKLDSKVRETVKFLVDKGLNNAAACGVAGNIYHESKFDTSAVGDGGTSFGICQWHAGRGTAMKTAVGSNWANNLTGQLEYLWTELNGSYSGVLSFLKGVSNTESGAKSAADKFVRQFEVPANVDSESTKRQAKAAEYFNAITVVAKSNSSNSKFSSVNTKNLTAERQARVQRAQAEIGKPYSWGAVGPDSYDCSGLVGYCLTGKHSRIGNTTTFMGWPQTSNPQPGDVCTSSSHCGLYIGDGKMIHAPNSNEKVQIGNVQSGMIYVTYG